MCIGKEVTPQRETNGEEFLRKYNKSCNGIVADLFTGIIQTNTMCDCCSFSISSFSPFSMLKYYVQDFVIKFCSIASPGLCQQGYLSSNITAIRILPGGATEESTFKRKFSSLVRVSFYKINSIRKKT